eukprot:CAMPEP_0177628454 /NCGR_PEP_ID=MMETSP0447-20121125/141_1 /TAXON_ID=0 /ORGANISM="Stygamoeba regulata, Strain BSH-02190019" /LENGTH=143 /DNA_ID=CAMNT_0019129705 /DNA_START=35 /DNA_END=466 /DNA_ORIENTATION=-
MKAAVAVLVVLALCSLVLSKKADLKVDVEYRPEHCDIKTKNGDEIEVHYVGKLEDGKEFDNSFSRGQPIKLILGKGHVIKGWEEGLVGMCITEKRVLTIPPELGYGARGYPPVIPENAVLIFETVLVTINGKGVGLKTDNIVQ